MADHQPRPDSRTTPLIPHDPERYVEEQYEIERNITSLIALPWDQCPWPAVRLKLLRIAIEGDDLYAYRPAHQPQYVIWHRQERPDIEARFAPKDWAVKYGYLVDDEREGQEGA